MEKETALTIWHLLQLQEDHDLGSLSYNDLTRAYPIIESGRRKLQYWNADELTLTLGMKDGSEIAVRFTMGALDRMETTINSLIAARDTIDD